MLSILIPVYNCNVTKLVKELHDQCSKAHIGFEILVFDDASQIKYKEKNREIANLFCVNYVELTSNLGRSKIRNRLAKTAIYDKLLFLDSDSSIPYRKFIKNYAELIATNKVICGGRIYSKKPPQRKSKHFHWVYGTNRESASLKKRKTNPTGYFHSNNFLIDRSLIIQHPFEEKVEGYGYEDILLGYRLAKADHKVTHIDNPVLHRNLDTQESFIEKHEIGAKNLAKLYQENKDFPVRLCKFYNTLKSMGIDNIIYTLLTKRSVKFKEKLLSEKPDLRTFDLFRLQVFISTLKKIDN